MSGGPDDRDGEAACGWPTSSAPGFGSWPNGVPEEVVIGLLGKFWTPRGGLRPEVTRAHFSAAPPPGFALAGWNFTVIPCGDGVVELRTETRVWCAPDARMKFRAYWFVVRPGSGLIRRAMLRAIRLQAERPAAACSAESVAAFGRGIPAGGVAPPSHTPGMLGRRALPSGRRAPKSTTDSADTGH